jgi:asparagine synthase (glutamine-hydrolysing)
MCGIYGITDKDPEFINQYINKCKHRGPDGQSVWHDNTVTLGHNLLSIMADPNVSKQPWITPKGNILVYNGEIFNYYELKQKYNSNGFAGTTGCDTELLAWGLDKFGLDFINEIDSMHGFAYYEVDKKQITLSRDHAGIKPVFYAEVSQGLIFGSEIKGMIDRVPNARTLDKLAVSFMSRTGINALRNTFFTGIKKLLAGETIVYDITNKKIIKTKRVYIKPNSNKPFDPKEFRTMVKQAVKQCSIGRRKIGVFLSGGLDSSLVAYELKQIRKEVNSFTNKMYPNVKTDEDYNEDSDCALVIANIEKFNHTEVKITPQAFIDSWDDSIYYMEQPVYNPSMAMYCYTNKFLSQQDIVITIAGDMGDEILGGYPKYWKMLRNPEWLKKQGLENGLDSWNAVLKLWLSRIKRPLKLLENPITNDTLLQEFAKCYTDELWNPNDPVASYMALDCVAQVPEEMFNRNDKYGMAYGMEGRFPLASKTFMQYCLNIPTKNKIGTNKNETKMLTKIAYKGIMPDAIINKGKTGWTVPIGHWLTTNIDSNLNTFYKNSIGEDSKINVIKASQKAGKAIVPAWIFKDWIKKYKMNF